MGCKVRLISSTALPLETVYAEWRQSRHTDEVFTAAEYARMRQSDHAIDQDIRETFDKVVSMDFPIAESLYFLFLIEDMPISLREQIVRHRIGHRFGGKLGADIVPDLNDSSFWSQSMRSLDMSKFFTNGEYFIPEGIEAKGEKAVTEYKLCLRDIEATYEVLLSMGVPPEDARNVMPLGVTHRMTWNMNLAALKAVVKKRTCWIAQLDLWKPLIMGILTEVAKLDPVFGHLANPPCINEKKFTGCGFCKENEARMDPAGTDPGVVCSLWYNSSDGPEKTSDHTKFEAQQEEYKRMKKGFGTLWNKNPEDWSKELVQVGTDGA